MPGIRLSKTKQNISTPKCTNHSREGYMNIHVQAYKRGSLVSSLICIRNMPLFTERRWNPSPTAVCGSGNEITTLAYSIPTFNNYWLIIHDLRVLLHYCGSSGKQVLNSYVNDSRCQNTTATCSTHIRMPGICSFNACSIFKNNGFLMD